MNFTQLGNSMDHRPKKERNQNYIGVWFHDKNSPSSNEYQSMVSRLKTTFEYIQIFDDIHDFISYLFVEKFIAKSVVIISSVIHGASMYECVGKQMEKGEDKFGKLYVLFFEHTNQRFDHRMYTSIDELFSKIESDVECCSPFFSPIKSETDEDARTQTVEEPNERKMLPPFGVMKSPIPQCSIRHLSNESLRFIQFQTLVEILLLMKHDEQQAKDDMLAHCRAYYLSDHIELIKIEHFKNQYEAENAILHYTEDGFCFRMVNRALRSEDIEHIYTFRMFITDLHNELKRRSIEKQVQQENITVYRGKRLPNSILQQLIDNVRSLISMNGFLSTTKNEDAAKAFSGDDTIRDNHTSVIFELHIKKLNDYRGKPFVDISPNENDPDCEQEVLFSVGTVWHIDHVRKKDHLWYITLTYCYNLDDDIRKRITNLSNGYTFLSIGNLLEELGEDDKAEKFYRRMLENESYIKDEDKGLLYYHIGKLRDKIKDWHGALDIFDKAIPYFPTPTTKPKETASSPNLITNTNPSNLRLTIYYNMGVIHFRNKNRAKAREAWKNALAASESSEELAKVHECIGDLALECGNHDEAAQHLQEAVKLIKGTISANEEVQLPLKRKLDAAIQLRDQLAPTSATSKKQRRSQLDN